MRNYDGLRQKLKTLSERSPGSVCVCFYDIGEKTGFSLRGREKMRSASLIKLLVLAELMGRWEEGTLDLTEKISLSTDERTGGDGILQEFSKEHTFSLEELAVCMITLSDNEATNLLIDYLGMENINRLACKLGLEKTKLQRKMMDYQAVEEGRENFTCGEDIKKLLLYMYEGAKESRASHVKMLSLLKKQMQAERLTREIAQEEVFAHKCGELEGLEHDGGIFFLPQGDYLLVAMTDDMASNLEAKQLLGKIGKLVYDELTVSHTETIYLTGEAKTGTNNAITKVYGSFFLAFELERTSGRIYRMDSNATLQLTKDFIAEIFVGKCIGEELRITDEIKRRYFGTSAKAIIAAYHDALKHFESLSFP